MNRFIVVGLGNPGKKYGNTRHNAGKMLVRWMKEEGKRKKEEGKLELIESESFMNESGEWVKSQLNRLTGQQVNRLKNTKLSNLSAFQPASLFICHDDLDIPLGKFKIQFGTGPKLHKGILSIEQALGTTEFWRVRIGTDGRPSALRGSGPNGFTGSQVHRFTGQQANRRKSAKPSNLVAFSREAGSGSAGQPGNLSGEDYVLSNFKREERKLLETDVFPKIGEELGEIISTNKYK